MGDAGKAMKSVHTGQPVSMDVMAYVGSIQSRQYQQSDLFKPISTKGGKWRAYLHSLRMLMSQAVIQVSVLLMLCLQGNILVLVQTAELAVRLAQALSCLHIFSRSQVVDCAEGHHQKKWPTPFCILHSKRDAQRLR